MLALLHAGYLDEAGAWVNWLIRAIQPETERARVFYGVIPGGEVKENEANWLPGFNESRPVRIGNSARDQLQLDIYGEVQDTLRQWHTVIGKDKHFGWAQQRAMLNRLDSLVDQPDAGFWEQRGRREYFTESRVMAWAAYDRALQTADFFGVAADLVWARREAALRAEICTRGFDPSLGSFTRAYGSRSLDASSLLIPLVGFLPANDPRAVGTVGAVRRHLGAGPFIYRYDAEREEDGVAEPEGAFLACSFWLADNLILQGQDDAAAEIFESVVSVANDLGLLSEEYDPSQKLLLGNFPQALTHLGVVHTALNLAGRGPAHSRSEGAHRKGRT